MMNEKTDKLEKFVNQNREAFDEFEPPAHLFTQIAKEVDKQKKPAQKNRFLYYTQRVAAAIIIALAAYGVTDIVMNLRSTQTQMAEVQKVSEENTELGEAMLYYATQVNSKRIELEEKAQQYPEILEEIKTEFDELDHEYQNLEEDLKEDVSNQMVIEAMIRNAKIKLEILEEMNSEMTRIAEKNNNHEESTQL